MSESVKRSAVLEGVARIGYDIHLCPFPGSLYSCLAYLGTPRDYDYLMGVTGAAFRRFWNRDDGGNVDLFYLGDEPARRAFAALGYAWHHVPPDKAAMLAAIKESIGRGVPAIAFGIIGPPEAGLVTGYAEDGEVLLGWSHFQADSAAYYEQPGWSEKMEQGSHANLGVIIIDGPVEPQPARRAYLDALRGAVDLECTAAWPGVPDHVSGLAAYEAWASALEVDADYPAGDSQALGVRVMVHGDQAVMLTERTNAAGFLRQAAGVLSEAAAPLQAAAELYGQAGDCVGRVWPFDHSMGPVTQQQLAQPSARREAAQAVREAGKLETTAVTHLQQALAILSA